VRLPSALVRTWSHQPAWIDGLPQLVSECAEQWSLALEDPIDTPHSLVIPAGELVLKLNAPSHTEAETEADALERWAGNGAVLLVARDDARHALLLERCIPGLELWHGDVDETEVVAELLPRLQITVADDHPFTLLAAEADRWAHDVPRWYDDAGAPFKRSLLEAALDVYRTVDRAADVLVNQDLHGGNVLSAAREPWLVIDPKPLVGERELEASGPLRNAASATRLLNGWADLSGEVSHWLDVLTDLGFDRNRARGWGVAHNLAWAWDEHDGWIGEHVAIASRILNAR
jgi:streptomycin 6-kinase